MQANNPQAAERDMSEREKLWGERDYGTDFNPWDELRRRLLNRAYHLKEWMPELPLPTPKENERG